MKKSILAVLFIGVLIPSAFAVSPISTTYPRCNEPDVVIWKQSWAHCDIAGSFVFGTNTDIKNLDIKKYNPVKSKWKEWDKNMCNVWYHIATKNEWKELFNNLSCKLNTGVGNRNQKCGKTIISELNFAGNGTYWTSSENSRSSAWKFRINLNKNDKDYGYSSLSTDSKTKNLSIRCIKN